MRLVVVAVGQRLPTWVDTAVGDYAKRFPPEARLELKIVKAEPRGSGESPARCLAAEAERLEAALPRGARRVVLDERGEAAPSAALAARLDAWKRDGRDVALLIGGADGLAASLRRGADETLRLSDLTLPHGLCRLLLVEALYRAWSIGAGHPYHRP